MRVATIVIAIAVAASGALEAGAVGFTGGGLVPAGAKVEAMVSDGTVAGTTLVGTLGGEAFRMDDGIVTMLGDLAGGPVASNAHAISGDGSTVVGRGDDGAKRAVYWDADDNLIQLSTDFSEAFGVNFDGSVIVGQTKSGPVRSAVKWVNGVQTALADVAGGKDDAIAVGVSDDGNWVVGSGTNASGRIALMWDSSGVITEIGDLVGGKGDAIATDVNADGTVVVGSADTAAGTEAFRWEGGAMVSLGDLAGGKTDARATGVSADGSIIVGVGTSAAGSEAFIWTETDGIMRSLREYLITEFGLGTELTGWTLDSVTSISADGGTIVGLGTNNGTSQVFVAQIPEPSTFAMLMLGLIGLGWAGRRRCA